MQDHIEGFLDDVETSKAEGTYRGRKTDMKKYDTYLERKGVDVTDATAKHVHLFLREQGEEYASGTVNNIYDSVKVLYDYLLTWDEIEEDEHPIEESSYGRADYGGNGDAEKHQTDDIVYVDPEEKELLREHVPNPKLRNELIVELMFQTGVRRGELARIEMDNIDRDARAIRVWSPKTSSWRTVYYQPSLDLLLDQWLDHGHRDACKPAEASPYLIVTTHSERASGTVINEVVVDAAKNAGIQDVLYIDAAGQNRYRVTAHALRHGHAVQAIKNDIDIRRLQLHMGHEKIETTQKYLRFKNEDIQVAMRKFDPSPEDTGAA